MTTFSLRPTIMYVTDPSLAVPEHKRILRQVIDVAEDFNLRVAFRLPETPDEEFYHLLDWYWNEEAKTSPAKGPGLPLLHYRPGMPESLQVNEIWMASRFLGTPTKAAAYSVHNRRDVDRAIGAGASEVIFGHVFDTESHPGEKRRGIDGLVEARKGIVNTPGATFTAIGGINEGSMYALGSVQLMSVACIRAISRSPDIARTLSEMQQQWNRGLTASLEKGQQP